MYNHQYINAPAKNFTRQAQKPIPVDVTILSGLLLDDYYTVLMLDNSTYCHHEDPDETKVITRIEDVVITDCILVGADAALLADDNTYIKNI